MPQIGEMYLARARELRALEMSSHLDLHGDDDAAPPTLAWNEAVQSRKRAHVLQERLTGKHSHDVTASHVHAAPRPPARPVSSKPTKASQLRAGYTSLSHRPRCGDCDTPACC